MILGLSVPLKDTITQGGAPLNNLINSARPKPPPVAGAANITINETGLGTSTPLADLIQAGGRPLQDVTDQAKVITGTAGAPDPLKGVRTGNPFTDAFLEANLPIGINKGGVFESAAAKPAVVNVGGKAVPLPANFAEMGGIIYVYQNGEWINTNQSQPGHPETGWWSYLPPGFELPEEPKVQVNDPNAPVDRSTFNLSPGQGFNPDVGVYGPGGAKVEGGDFYKGGTSGGSTVFAAPGSGPPVETPTIPTGTGQGGTTAQIPMNLNLADSISGGGGMFDALIKLAQKIQSLGFDPNTILSNPNTAMMLLDMMGGA